MELFKENRPLISVVVPVYNVEEFLPRCLESLIAQSYRELEIILVNDGSPDGSATIMKKYQAQDARIHIVEHEKNRGLFQARISGSEAATGKYICFVDSDDYVSFDWFRTLADRAEESGADITVGEWCYDHAGEVKNYNTLDPFRIIEGLELRGEEVLRAFMEQEGQSFSWHVMWNKLYTRALWNECLPDFRDFSREHGHMLMWEDIAFSSGLWCRAQHVVNAHGAHYYYFQHSGASTSPNKTRSRNEKYIRDSASAIGFMERMLKQCGRYEELQPHFFKWKENYAHIVYKDIVIGLGLKEYDERIRNEFDFQGQGKDLDFFYHLVSPLADAFSWDEELKRSILSPELQYVSFDIFDTLIQRPFAYPVDLFELLSDELNDRASAYIDFKNIRIMAEQQARREKRLYAPQVEEVTLDEIYAVLQRDCFFSEETAQWLKQREMELELRYCFPRQKGKELYRLALWAGKTVIICSDMYLPRELVENILQKNGYTGYHRLYLSSEIKLSKASGNLFRHVKKDLDIEKGSSLLHIGDNWDSDIVKPQSYGFRAAHLSKAVDLGKNQNPGVYSGELYARVFEVHPFRENSRSEYSEYYPLRTAYALPYYRFFDSPFVSFHSNSDFNANPNFIGYAALGPHLLALSHWISGIARREHIPTIHFVARDGYLPKRAFDLLNTTETRSSYIYLSRKALVLADIDTPEDLNSLFRKVNPTAVSPKSLYQFFYPIIPHAREYVGEALEKNAFIFDSPFGSTEAFYKCLNVFTTELMDFSLLPAYKEKLRAYFAGLIQPGDYIFDVGYSGRPESALSNLLGFPVHSLYLHKNSDLAARRQNRYGCKCECFYSRVPSITGVIREHLLMAMAPSAVGYREDAAGGLKPIFEDYQCEYSVRLITELVQEAAIDYVSDFKALFGDYMDRMDYPREAMSANLEYYLHYAKPFDREIFSTLQFEDSIGSGEDGIRALDFWNQECLNHNLFYGSTAPVLPPELRDIDPNGLLIKIYRWTLRLFPIGGKARETMKKLGRLFFR